MLIRQKAILGLLTQLQQPLNLTPFVKLAFLLRFETLVTQKAALYDFVPYRFGPFSFTLYRELGVLRRNGYIAADKDRVELLSATQELTAEKVAEIPTSIGDAVVTVVDKYGRMSHTSLLEYVYSHYPWYAINSELTDMLPPSLPRIAPAPTAIYTTGYQGKSVDGFLNGILQSGIQVILDVRANPVSRSYGFAGTSLREIANRLRVEYQHIPQLGIPSEERRGLDSYASYKLLLDRYEQEVLPARMDHVIHLAKIARERPAVLLCMEENPQFCHRGRLAHAMSEAAGIPIVHLG